MQDLGEEINRVFFNKAKMIRIKLIFYKIKIKTLEIINLFKTALNHVKD
jgi:hypothetical protein